MDMVGAAKLKDAPQPMTTHFDRRRLLQGIQRAESHTPSDLAALKEKVVINCPGYGARALWGDGGDMKGYGVEEETPNRQESEAAVALIAELYSRFGAARHG
jgi:hypothetical protein